MPRYAVEVTQIERRTMTLYVNASNALEALDNAHEKFTIAHAEELSKRPAQTTHEFAKPQLRRAKPATDATDMHALADFLNANRQKC